MLDMSTLMIEDLTGRLRMVDDLTGVTATSADGKLLLTEEEWTSRMWEKRSGEGSSCRGGDGKHRVKALQQQQKKKDSDPLGRDICRRCGKTGH